MNNPLVSVIINNWNGKEDTIRAINSFLNSSYKNIEIIFVDMDSEDGSFEEISNILENLTKKDTKASLEWINKQTEIGLDTKDLILSLMDSLRNLVFIKNGLGSQLVEPNLMEENYQKLVEFSQSFTNSDLVKNLDSLQKALEKMKTSSIPSLPLEIAVVEMTQSVILSPKDEGSLADASTLNELHTRPSDVRDSSLIVQNDKQEIATEPLAPRNDDSPDILKIKEKWTFVLETIRPFNFSLEALLRSINVRECTEIAVIMEVPYSFHQRILEAPKNRDLLESIFSEILGRSIKISTVLGNRPTREDIANIEVAADDEIIRAAAEIFNSDSIN